MKIGPLDNKPAPTPVAERKTGTQGAGKAHEPSAKVELSHTAAHLTAGHTDGTFDAEKVKRLATAIKQGKFEVHPEAIADKLIANAQELLSKKTS